ncbi:MAG TPA: choice-of-anchor tandem repeat NxxGxxAF-containing protein [Tepidisphaeraceae bacterium]|jgi:hypothetical protein
MHRSVIASLGCVVAIGAPALPTSAAAIYRTVVLSGTQAPGTPTGAKFRAFSNVLLTSDGKTVFSADLQTGSGGVTSQNSTGIWSEALGPLSLVARIGDQAPGTPTGTRFQSSDVPIIGPDRQVAFVAYLTGAGVTSLNDTTVWAQQSGGALTLVAREGDPIPNAPAGTTIADIAAERQLAIGPAGKTSFAAFLKGPAANGRGIVSSDGTTLALVAQSGTQAAGLPAGANYGTFEYGMLGTDAQANVAFFGLLQVNGATVTDASDDAIWHGNAGNLRLVARQGDPAPGAPAGTAFGNLGPPTVNANGQVAFRAELPGGGSGIWSERSGGTLAAVARAGEQAPGTPAGATFDYLRDQAINDAGRTAFVGSLELNDGGVTSSNDTGIWSDGSGALALIAREGSQAPGTPPGAVFDLLDPPVMNGAGRVAFRARLLSGSGGITADNDLGVWAEDPNGVLSLVVREGDPFELAPGDVRTIQGVGFRDDTGPSDFPGAAYTDDYTLAFSLLFTDGTDGVFTATLVPEPATAGLALLAAFAMRRRSRRRI